MGIAWNVTSWRRVKDNIRMDLRKDGRRMEHAQDHVQWRICY